MNTCPKIMLNMGQKKREMSIIFMGMKAQDDTENKNHLQCYYNLSQVLISSQNPCTVGMGCYPFVQRGEVRLRKQERHFQRGEWHPEASKPLCNFEFCSSPTEYFAWGQKGLLNRGCRSSTPKPPLNHLAGYWQNPYCAYCKPVKAQICQIILALQGVRTCLKLAK